jgi:hypothetical protein
MATTAITRPTATKAMKPAYRRPLIRKRKLGIPLSTQMHVNSSGRPNPAIVTGHPGSRASRLSRPTLHRDTMGDTR